MIVMLSSLAFACYFLRFQPHRDRFDLIVDCVNEGFVLVAIFSFVGFGLCISSTKQHLGDAVVLVTLSVFAVNWLMILIMLLFQAIRKIKLRLMAKIKA